MDGWFGPPSVIDTGLDSRSATFENPTGARGAGGAAAGGRKGAPARAVAPGETVTLLDAEGPGTVRRLWMTFPPAPPEVMRGLLLTVTYDDLDAPSVAVPCLDLFCLPHGRPVPFTSALTAAQEGRGFNAYLPMPFRQRVVVELTNASDRTLPVFYQLDYTLEPELDDRHGYLHVSWRRENPTTMRRDMVIAEGLRGPGRFLGCSVGVRVLDDGLWYGEGEVKVFRDGDTDLPTICGTGLEDYAGTAWGMGAHASLFAGAPLEVKAPDAGLQPAFVGFYRWHLADPVVFATDLRVTIQQIGYAAFRAGEDDAFEAYAASHPAAGEGWQEHTASGLRAAGIAERVDDVCATAFVYCAEPQPVPVLDPAAVLADIGRLPFEEPSPFEAMLADVAPPT